MKNILAVVVTYNRKELLMEVLTHLFAQEYKDFDILVVDNHSSDHTLESISHLIDTHKILYENTGSNLGGAGGFHYGIKKGMELGYSYFWIMDDDAMASPTALKELYQISQKIKNYGFLCSDVRFIDHQPCVMNIPVVDNDWCKESDLLKLGLLRVKSCSFVSCFIPASVIKEVGYPIKEFFIWGDDVEYTKRISMKYPCYFVSTSKIIHKMKQNLMTNIVEDSSDRLMRYEYMYRNMYYVARMENRKMEVLRYHYRTFMDLLRVCKSHTKNKWKKVKIIIKSHHAGRKFHPQIEQVEDHK